MSSKAKTCKFCQKTFSCQPSKSRHQNYYCKQNPNVKKPGKSKQPETQDGNTTIEQQLKEILNIIKMSNPQTNVHYGDNVQNVFVVNNYGSETTHHITSQFLDDCMSQRKKGLLQLIDKIHFNPDVPENHNVKIVSKKREVMGVYKDGDWVMESKHSVLHDLIDKGYKILYKHYIDTVDKDEDDQSDTSYYDFLMDVTKPKSLTYYQLRKDLFVMIENATLYVVGK